MILHCSQKLKEVSNELHFMRQIKIWDDLKASPLVVLRPHDGQPVYSAMFLTATDQPDHIILVTAVHTEIFTFIFHSLAIALW
jgi:hypothetical protein